MNSFHGWQMLVAVCMVCCSVSDVTGTSQVQAVKAIERKPHKDPVLTCDAVLARGIQGICISECPVFMLCTFVSFQECTVFG